MDELHKRIKEELISKFIAPSKHESAFERFIRDHLIIPTSCLIYQIWKLLIIVFSFMSSFYYAYSASIYAQMSPE